jgi:hypothetical protein
MTTTLKSPQGSWKNDNNFEITTMSLKNLTTMLKSLMCSWKNDHTFEITKVFWQK